MVGGQCCECAGGGEQPGLAESPGSSEAGSLAPADPPSPHALGPTPVPDSDGLSSKTDVPQSHPKSVRRESL